MPFKSIFLLVKPSSLHKDQHKSHFCVQVAAAGVHANQ